MVLTVLHVTSIFANKLYYSLVLLPHSSFHLHPTILHKMSRIFMYIHITPQIGTGH